MNKKKVQQSKTEDESKPRAVDKSPIYITVRKMNGIISQAVARMSKDYKYQIGSLILKQSFILATTITRAYRAYNVATQIEYVKQVIDECDTLISMLQVAYDNRIIARTHFVLIIESCTSIQKQSTGWMEYIISKNKQNNS